MSGRDCISAHHTQSESYTRFGYADLFIFCNQTNCWVLEPTNDFFNQTNLWVLKTNHRFFQPTILHPTAIQPILTNLFLIQTADGDSPAVRPPAMGVASEGVAIAISFAPWVSSPSEGAAIASAPRRYLDLWSAATDPSPAEPLGSQSAIALAEIGYSKRFFCLVIFSTRVLRSFYEFWDLFPPPSSSTFSNPRVQKHRVPTNPLFESRELALAIEIGVAPLGDLPVRRFRDCISGISSNVSSTHQVVG